MNKFFIFLFAIIILASCGSKQEQQKASDNLLTPDSSAQTITSSLNIVMDKFKTKSTLPFMGDTTLLFKVNTFDSLGAGEVHTLDTNWFRKSIIAPNPYNFRNFYDIDSIKAIGAYKKWCDSLDIGMTKYANAYALFRIDKDPETTLLMWATCISSYEACPFSTETALYCTVVYKGFITQTFMLANYTSAGDPPSMFQSNIRGIFNTDGTIELNLHEVHEDLDEPSAEEIRSQYSYLLSNGKVFMTGKREGKTEKVKRERENPDN